MNTFSYLNKRNFKNVEIYFYFYIKKERKNEENIYFDIQRPKQYMVIKIR